MVLYGKKQKVRKRYRKLLRKHKNTLKLNWDRDYEVLNQKSVQIQQE
jgi:hypothetical protein